MLARISGTVRFKEPLSFHTSLRIGGPADFFIMPQSLDDVRYAVAFAQQEDMPIVLLGGGNNVLISDDGLQAVVVKLAGMFSRAEFHGDEASVGAGVGLSGLLREAAAHDLGGLECLAGIPGTIGGALVTNAGTREGSLIDFCTAVYFLQPHGEIGEFRPAGHAAGQAFTPPPGAIVLGCRLRLLRRPMQKIQKDIQQRLKQRRASQPFALASAGYVWKHPHGALAERLIDAVGLRGKRLNGAEISVKSSNLIVNRGGAGHADVLALMEMARERVEGRFGITLQSNLKLMGLPARSSTVEHGSLALAGAR